MNFPDYFADADSDYKDSDYVIFGIPYDKTSSFRMGASSAPKEVRFNSWNFETFNIRNKVDFKDIRVHDYGNLSIKNKPINDVMDEIKSITKMLIKDNKFPVAIGGEHSLTSAIIEAHPKDIAVLSLDAHLDYRDVYENEKYNHACVMRRISERINIKDIAILGIRSAEKDEYYEAKNDGLFWIEAFDINKNGIKNCLNEIKNRFFNKKIYLTLDIDVLDLSYAPGTSTPEPFGISPKDVLHCIEFFSEDIIGFDIMEVCPPYDKGETALISAKFIKSLIEETWLKKQ